MKLRAPLAVLVVDDEPRSLETLRRTLEEDFTVFTALSAEEGEVVMAREFVQIVLCDQRMPGMQGVEFLRRVRDQWPDTVRLILSGYTDAEDIIAGINQAGIWQYLLKPWHPEQLLLTLKSAADLWRLQQENQRLSLELRDSPEQLVQQVASRRGKVRARSGFDRLMRAADSPLNGNCELVPGEPWCISPQLADETSGVGLIEAARGSLGHWLTVRRGRIHNYQIIAPTTWNFSPRDSAGTPGALEQALAGLPASATEPLPAAIHHVVRSFDPCMVCTVH